MPPPPGQFWTEFGPVQTSSMNHLFFLIIAIFLTWNTYVIEHQSEVQHKHKKVKVANVVYQPNLKRSLQWYVLDSILSPTKATVLGVPFMPNKIKMASRALSSRGNR